MSDSLQPHGLQHTRLPYPSLSPEFAQTHVHWIGDAIQPSHSLFLLPSIFSGIRVFSSESALCIRWPKYWSFSISPSNEYSGLISFTIDWIDLLAVQGTLKSVLQHLSSKASIIWCSNSFMVQLSHPYMATEKNIALTIWTFVSKLMFLLFNMLSMFIIAFLPRSKRLLISWLQPPSTVILEPKKVKSLNIYIVSPSICHEVMGPDVMITLLWELPFPWEPNSWFKYSLLGGHHLLGPVASEFPFFATSQGLNTEIIGGFWIMARKE